LILSSEDDNSTPALPSDFTPIGHEHEEGPEPIESGHDDEMREAGRQLAERQFKVCTNGLA
jgi:hypothetical protein